MDYILDGAMWDSIIALNPPCIMVDGDHFVTNEFIFTRGQEVDIILFLERCLPGSPTRVVALLMFRRTFLKEHGLSVSNVHPKYFITCKILTDLETKSTLHEDFRNFKVIYGCLVHRINGFLFTTMKLCQH